MAQSFENHTQWTPAFHFIASPLAGVFLIWSIKRVISNPGADTAYMLIGALALFTGIFAGRLAALRVQDRLIRLEERLRLARVLPVDLHGRIEELRPRHLVALRFASDGEVTELVRSVLSAPDMQQKEIKRQIRAWREDYFRA
jgi:hypothetical protein